MSRQKLTHSRMQSLKLCRRNHYYAYELGYRRETDAKALRMGSAYHEGLDVLKKTGDLEQAISAVAQEYADCPEIIEQWDWDIERETVETLLAGYAWRWSEQTFLIVASEHSFSLPLKNPESGKATPLFNLAGKIDGIIQEGDRMLTLEHKLVGEDISCESDYWRRLQIDSQITTYAHAARQEGYDVSGVLYDLTRKPSIKPSQVPLLDDNGLKQVFDSSGVRIRNKSIKPKKNCESCKGKGVFGECENLVCPCTFGSWRQTADREKGFAILSRSMTPHEWSERLLEDIGKRPEWYYQRQEIAVLDDSIDEFLAETWEIQKTLRDAQKKGAWYKTVNMGSCSYCPYFSLCASKHTHDGTAPEGFVLVDDVHPELGGE